MPAEFGRFFLPGPSEVHPDVLRAMVRPMIPHRGPQCAELLAHVQPVLAELYGTGQPVLISASSATAMMEAGVRALPSGRVLALVNGAFSRRFADIAAACGREAEVLEVEWGEAHDPDAVAERLRGGAFAGVTLVHSETSTGALQPLAEIAAAAGETPLVIDTVTSFAATPIEFDARGLAFVCAGSQKALALPPGLGFAVASPALLESAPVSSFYLDLNRYAKNPPPFTPALPQLYALEAQAGRIRGEGVAARFDRHAAMARRTWEWAAEAGLEVLAPEGRRSPTVTCIRAPGSTTGPEIAARLAERGFVVGAGYGRLREATFRIGHMGDQTPGTLEALLEVCRELLVR